ncbi:hypothetical protein CkaCkLH20_10206 [Colletotrichum karsti]|uniref:Uncharacterized protein n=1 Tax=Colletotrichum karsti TaxID=1095194 RepID=A0A9P6HXT1_9PEZI|nr:uncharacterized protein CkaCkLH20_10206 [Colletotrichum karsti]KAF9872379.1 hypothetical protein CkaCkLH20_10206 [Colletotrichum karsti]
MPKGDWSFARQTRMFNSLKDGKSVAEVAKIIKMEPFLVERQIRWLLLIKLCDEICPFYSSQSRPWTSTEEDTLLKYARSPVKLDFIAKKPNRELWDIRLQFIRIKLADFGPNDRGVQYRAIPDIQFDPRPYHELYEKLLENSVSFIKAPKLQGATISLTWTSFVLVMSQVGNFNVSTIAKKCNTAPYNFKKRLREFQDALPCVRDLQPADNNETDSKSTEHDEQNAMPINEKEGENSPKMVMSCKRPHMEEVPSENDAKRQKTDHEDMGEPCFDCGKHGHH